MCITCTIRRALWGLALAGYSLLATGITAGIHLQLAHTPRAVQQERCHASGSGSGHHDDPADRSHPHAPGSGNCPICLQLAVVKSATIEEPAMVSAWADISLADSLVPESIPHHQEQFDPRIPRASPWLVF